ncbi:MAG: hypothetical protein OEY48_06110 [Gammaproteobacteria bacterium]|nr:hypothetical protein [Gammaproteobacteria bacterium]MDH5592407.1 hypothetical protein [Gammaproteobacteria bacterium]
MKIKTIFIALLAALLVGCVDSASVKYGDSAPHYKKGPPPHAPAHGYRHKHQQHDMIYDSGIRAYVVVGWLEHYFDEGFYFRFRDGRWQMSASLNDGEWKDARDHDVPKGLWKARKHKGKHSKHHKEHPGKGKKPDWDD